jgi:HAD superfamily hydrolase (TIGR01509 family)
LRRAPDAIIFDFDGVIADSEVLANRVLAEMVTALGRPTSLDDALGRYVGKRLPDLIAAIEADAGQPVAGTFSHDLQARTLARFRSELREIPGARAFLDAHSAVKRCIASSSSHERLALSLEVLGLAGLFAGAVFSADEVARGKPHPDLFLMAARRLEVDPAHCLVIEDSASGVQAGVAAGMTVVGFCAGGHVRAGHADRLAAAGTHHMASGWHDVAALLRKLD